MKYNGVDLAPYMVKRIPKSAFVPTLGQQVTVTEPQTAYNFDNVTFGPGDVGVIGAVDVPAVRAPWDIEPYIDKVNGSLQWKKVYPRGKEPVFACIDFERDGVKYRTAAYYDQIKPIAEG